MLSALVSNPEVWSKTVLFHMYDENDGFFDHVAPPVAPPGTAGRVPHGLAAARPTPTARPVPIGMSFRVPMLVLSPFSRGGHVASEVFDHTSQLRFFEERFGVKAPNISAWRRHTAGDLTSTLHPKRSDPTVPKLPSTSKDQEANVMALGCTQASIIEAAPASRHAGVPGAGGAVHAQAGDGLIGTPGPATESGPGTIVVLNGTPRSGKSTLARAVQQVLGRDLGQPGRRRVRGRAPEGVAARHRPASGR